MYIGTSIFLIAVGAILKWAVTGSISGLDVQTAGLILLIVGILGLVLSLLMMSVWRDRDRDRDPRYRDPV
jgi:heme/copper-type cytochrome/quinol oxidase subunit 2